MLGLALALIVAGIVLGLITFFGFIIAVVGVILLVVYLVGFGRRAREGRP